MINRLSQVADRDDQRSADELPLSGRPRRLRSSGERPVTAATWPFTTRLVKIGYPPPLLPVIGAGLNVASGKMRPPRGRLIGAVPHLNILRGQPEHGGQCHPRIRSRGAPAPLTSASGPLASP